MSQKQAIEDALLWCFDPHNGFDKPFHRLVAVLGVDAVMALDELILEDTRNAARNAVKYHQEKMIAIGIDKAFVGAESRELMQALTQALKDVDADVSHDPLLPQEAVCQPPTR